MSRMGLSFCFARMKKNGWSLFQRIIPIHMDLLASLGIPRGPQPVRCTSKEHTVPRASHMSPPGLPHFISRLID